MYNSSLNTRTRLSFMWVFVVLNFLARDFHELARPGILKQMIAGSVNGTEITERLMLLGGVMIEVPILMTILTLFTNKRIGRWVNIIAAIFTMIIIGVNNLEPDLDNIFFMIIQLVALVYIIHTAWKWPPENLGGHH